MLVFVFREGYSQALCIWGNWLFPKPGHVQWLLRCSILKWWVAFVECALSGTVARHSPLQSAGTWVGVIMWRLRSCLCGVHDNVPLNVTEFKQDFGYPGWFCLAWCRQSLFWWHFRQGKPPNPMTKFRMQDSFTYLYQRVVGKLEWHDSKSGENMPDALSKICDGVYSSVAEAKWWDQSEDLKKQNLWGAVCLGD